MSTAFSLQQYPVAIIGMSGLFAGAQNLAAFWENIAAQLDCITDVPPSRWNLDDYYDPDPRKPDKTYSRVGGFIPDIDFDPLAYGLPPNILEVTDSSQILSLVLAKQALQDAGYEGKRFPEEIRKNTGVILGVGGGQKLVSPLSSRLQYPVWRKVLRQYGLSEEQVEEAVEKMKAAYVAWQENAFPGFLGNVIAGRIANRFDLGGTNCVVDAACAASLSALKMAISELVEHRCDMMITGGVDTDNSPMTYLSFSKTPAFSRKNQIRPFDAEADGMVVGEGIGMLVLKRLADAERDGDRIYAIIRGIGSSSDGRHSSIYAPVTEGQQLALERAYREAGYSPATVRLLEAHGTGTPAGDRVEFQSITALFQKHDAPAQQVALGSVKSQIGHTKVAAGAASLIKTALALHHKVLPPTINVTQPNPRFGMDQSPFYLNTQLRPWFQPGLRTPRRAGVSAFGFGGTNFHVTLEEYQPEHGQPYRQWSPVRTALLCADHHAGLLQRCEQVLAEAAQSEADPDFPVPASVPPRAPRLGFVFASREELITRLTLALQTLRQSDPHKPWEHPQGIYYSPRGMAPGGKVAVLFAGQGSQYVGMGSTLACLYPEFRQTFGQTDQAMQALYGETLSDKVYPVPVFDEAAAGAQQKTLTQTQYAQPAIGAISMALYRLFTRAGLRPDMVGGHSFGELTALWAGGVLPEADYLKLACLRGRVMAEAARGEDAGGMLAVPAGLDTIRQLLSGQSLNLEVANINAPDQVVLGGAVADVERAAVLFSSHRIYAKVLPVSAAFHTRRLREAQQPLAEAIGNTVFGKPQCLVFSNIDGQPYPAEGGCIREQFKDHMLSSVQFRQQIEAMYQAGARVFVEIGPRNILSRLVQSTLRSQSDYQTIAANENARQDSALLYAQALVQLWVAGVPVRAEDPYRLAPPPREVSRKMSLRMGAHNYVGETTREKWTQAVPPGAPEAAPPARKSSPTPPLQPMNQPLQPHSDGHVPAFLPQPVAASLPVPEVARPAQVSPQPMQQQIDLLDEMIAFHVQQREALEKHRAFLEQYQRQMHQLFAEAPQPDKHAPIALPKNGRNRLRTLPVAAGATPAIAAPRMRIPAEAILRSNGHHSAAATAEKTVPAALPAAPAVPEPVREPVALPEAVVLALVADKTGYPAEMLNLDMELEADLGIDSIKQVEIFGAIREQVPGLPQWDTADFAQLKTLRNILARVNQPAAISPDPVGPPPEPTRSQTHEEKEVSLPVVVPVATGSSAAEERDHAQIAETLLGIIADKTGYPAEMLNLDMELEADLGIDSIKQVEIFGAIREQYPDLPPLEPGLLATLQSIGDVLGFIGGGVKKKRAADDVAPADGVSVPGPEAEPAREAGPAGSGLPQLPQGRVRVKPLPRPFSWERPWTAGSVALLTHDGTDLTGKLARALTERKFRVVVLCLPGVNCPPVEDATLVSLPPAGDNQVQQVIGRIGEQGTISLFVHLHPAGNASAGAVQAVFWIAKHLHAVFHGSEQGPAAFMTVLRLDGALGYGAGNAFDWQAGGLTGLVKSLNREWPGVYCRAVDLHPALGAGPAVECLLAELQDTDVALAEVGYDAGLRRATVATESVPATGVPAIPFGPSDVVLVSGGGRGITAECVKALAQRCACTFLLLGRTRYQPEEPAWAEGITGEKALKQAIFRALGESGLAPLPREVQALYGQIVSSREIGETLRAIARAGGRAQYVEADITDAATIRTQLHALQSTWGKITGLVHGAGTLADKRVGKKTEADLARVYDTKVQGLLNLLSGLEAGQLSHLVLFSSVAGFYGNEGQTDYALANDTLNKFALSYGKEHPHTKAVSLNWGPWEMGMVTPFIRQEFEGRGVQPIGAGEGAAHFLHALAGEGTAGVRVVNAAFPAPAKSIPFTHSIGRIGKTVKREENPFLEHHVIGGHPVMPFVTGMAWIAGAAEQLLPGYRLVQYGNSKLFNGIIFNGKQPDAYFLDLEITQRTEEAVHLAGKVWSLDGQERRRYHYGTDVVLARSAPAQPRVELPRFAGHPIKTRAELYAQGSLFHGPAYQGMEALWAMNEQEVWYTCRLPEPDPSVQGQFPLQGSRTFLTDAMCQGFLVWAYRYLDASCLPAGMGRMDLYEPLPFDESFWVKLSITGQQGAKLTGNATAIGAGGKVLMTVANISLTISKELLSLYRKEHRRIALVDMDIRLPNVPDLNAFHRAVYD
ncbi:MAG: SDR family NAD(P)-dependent oxidoreductase, partial [Cytophagales bacterium]|nr:SDR family NAD(P)-dependent oxidoreductase [Cytophagales bacterium]